MADDLTEAELSVRNPLTPQASGASEDRVAPGVLAEVAAAASSLRRGVGGEPTLPLAQAPAAEAEQAEPPTV